MNPLALVIESLGWRWLGPVGFFSDRVFPHYVLSRVPQTDAATPEDMVNLLTLAGWTIKRPPFLGHLDHTYLWACPPRQP